MGRMVPRRVKYNFLDQNMVPQNRKRIWANPPKRPSTLGTHKLN